MFALRRTAALVLSSRSSHAIFSQSRSITSISPTIRTSPRSTILSVFQKRFASDILKENNERDFALEDNMAPDTTSAAQFDASDIEPIEAREISQEEQAEPIEALQGKPVDSDTSRLRVDGKHIRTGPLPPAKQLYIGNLYFDVTEEDLQKEFSRFGDVARVKIIKDARGMSKGFGYVDFTELEQAVTARDAMDRQTFEGRRLNVQYAEPRSLDQVTRERNKLRERTLAPPSRTLYVGNMSFDLSDQDLSKLFSGVKNVLDVRVAIDRRTGQPRGFAHADFTDIESAEAAFQKLNGKEVYGRVLRCDYSGPSSRVRQRGLE